MTFGKDCTVHVPVVVEPTMKVDQNTDRFRDLFIFERHKSNTEQTITYKLAAVNFNRGFAQAPMALITLEYKISGDEGYKLVSRQVSDM